jgi:hypothetical protein
MKPGKKRRQKPKILEAKDGPPIISCPFCIPPHPIQPNEPARCGTVLELRAVQQTYRSVDCVFCGTGAGTLVKIGEQYKHAFECTPGARLYAEPPELSKSAAFIWRLPNFIHKILVRRLGRRVIEVTNQGQVAGYAWENESEYGKEIQVPI